ncbi:alcohol dehydrogenase [Gongronella butleri]|nr:alcohol dehydrogenase [Gongronella butleri]
MKAAILKTRSPELTVEQVDEPKLTAGSAVVKVLAAPVVHYYRHVLSGAQPFPLQLPLIPGCSAVGVVESVGSDAGSVKVGDLVFCDPTIRTRDDPLQPQTILQGLFCPDSGLSETYRHGGFAERVLMPLENLFVIPASIGTKDDAARLTAVNGLLVAMGGLLKGQLQPGQTVIVLGGTGYFGSNAIVLALAMGARRVLAPTRDVAKLASLRDKLGPRLVPVAIGASEDENVAAFQQAAGGPIDMALDLLDANAPPTLMRSALNALRVNGTLVIMNGSIGTAELPYFPIMTRSLNILGNFMYPSTAGKQLLDLIDAGLVDLDLFDTSSQFGLDDINKALEDAENNARAFKLTVVTP